MLITGNLFIPNTYILGWAQRSYVQLLPRYVLSHKILQRCAPVVSKNVVKARYQLEILYYCIHLFKQFLQQINVKNVHPVHGAGIQNHDLRAMSLLS